MNRETLSPRGSKRQIVISALIFALCVAAVRAADLLSASLGADVMVSASIPEALNISGTVLSVLSAAFCGGALIYFSFAGGKTSPFFAASLFSAVIVLDRTFYVIYNIATKVKTFTPSYGAEAYIRVSSDCASFVAAFFITAAVCRAMRRRADSASELSFAVKGALAFSVALFALQSAYQVYVTVSFFAAYDDATSSEIAAIAGDFLFILLKYGVVQFGASLAFCKLLSALLNKERSGRKSVTPPLHKDPGEERK
ncbi:MAG: hypothetical protein IJS45_11700 [Clostridia bacterium]|nr:hypothetical protein [Clostridia bacterium]